MQVNSDNVNAANMVALGLVEYLLTIDNTPVIMCIGCDRVVGDGLAPMVGQILKDKYSIHAYVYGDLQYNITASTVRHVLKGIHKHHPNSPIIVIDAILGNTSDVGNVVYYQGGCYPASVYSSGVGKVGDYCILGVVGDNTLTKMNFVSGISLNVVQKLAQTISDSIARAYSYARAICNTAIDNIRQ